MDTHNDDLIVRVRQEGGDRGGAAKSDILGVFPPEEARRVAQEAAGRFGDGAHIHEWGLCITVHIPVPKGAQESVQRLREAYHRNRMSTERTRTELREAVLDLIEGGMGESEAARLAGVTRMTIRSWLGKR
jgi:hypothetical protein